MNRIEKIKELEEELDILEKIKKMVNEKCTGFELAKIITNLPQKLQKTLETHLISIDTAKEFKNNPFCLTENDSQENKFQLFKKFEVFVGNLYKLLEDTKKKLNNL